MIQVTKYRQVAEGTWCSAQNYTFAAPRFQLEVVFQRQEYNSVYDEPKHFGPLSVICHAPVFLQLTICSNQPKTALHTAALNGTQLIKLRTFIYYTCDEFFGNTVYV